MVLVIIGRTSETDVADGAVDTILRRGDIDELSGAGFFGKLSSEKIEK